MRVIVLAAVAIVLASCSTSQMPAATTTGASPQQASATDQREAPIPPAFRAPRQQSGTGWPNIGYQPRGNY